MPAALASDPANEVMFLSFYPRDDASTPGVVHARLRLDREPVVPGSEPYVEEWGRAFKLGRQTYRTLRRIRDSGFVPDMLFVAFSGGPALFIRHVFPEAFLVSCFDVMRRRDEGQDRAERFMAVRDMQIYQLTQSDMGAARSEAQKRTFPSALRPRLFILPPHVDTDFFSPRAEDATEFFPQAVAASEGDVVTFHMKGAGRSAHGAARTVWGLLSQRPQCRVALTFGNNGVRETWEKLCASLPDDWRHRLFFAGGLDRETYRRLLRVTSAHVFPEYARPPFQEMLESMSCETLALVPAPDGDDDLLKDGETVLTLPEDSDAQIAKIGAALDHTEEAERVRKNARRVMASRCDERAVFSEFMAQVMAEYETFQTDGRR